MKRGAATIAIVSTRLLKERRVLLLAASACALLAYLQRFDDAPARLAGCLAFGTLAGVTVALLQRGSGHFRELELCEQSAPLYGRELARATALVPCIIVTVSVAAYWIVSSLYAAPAPQPIALTLLAVYAATLIALSAGVRTGGMRWLYVFIACATPAIAFALGFWQMLASAVLCGLVAFIALRQYGEALARYDPV
jgi:hypothetical protein